MRKLKVKLNKMLRVLFYIPCRKRTDGTLLRKVGFRLSNNFLFDNFLLYWENSKSRWSLSLENNKNYRSETSCVLEVEGNVRGCTNITVTSFPQGKQRIARPLPRSCTLKFCLCICLFSLISGWAVSILTGFSWVCSWWYID